MFRDVVHIAAGYGTLPALEALRRVLLVTLAATPQLATWAAGRYPLPSRHWLPVQANAPSPRVIGSRIDTCIGAVRPSNRPGFARALVKRPPLSRRSTIVLSGFFDPAPPSDPLGPLRSLSSLGYLLRFTGPPVPINARAHSTPQRPFPFSHPVTSSPLSLTALPLVLLPH